MIYDWNAQGWEPEAKEKHSIRYSCSYKAGKAGKYLILAAAGGWNSDQFTVSVDGKAIPFPPHAEGQAPQSTTVELADGQTIKVAVDYLPRGEKPHFSLGIANEAELVTEEAKKIAGVADVAVVAAGFNPSTESEGMDRSFGLPWGQDALIEAVAAANAHTVVTLNSGGGTDTRRWLDKVPALLEAWYPGQEGGTAIADVLLGRVSPEGKLPMSFDRSWDENPSHGSYYPAGADTTLKVTEPGHAVREDAIAHVKYDDGLMVGYRYWTTTGKHPLYPFGFGLSYTTFSFGNLQVPATSASGATVAVSFEVTNTGKMAGAEVAQLYVSDPSAKAQRPERELKGFEKVRMGPGETKHVTISLDARAFSYWDAGNHKWTIDPGKFVIRVGNSSENTPLNGDVTIN
jgi:beta-glucosidase